MEFYRLVLGTIALLLLVNKSSVLACSASDTMSSNSATKGVSGGCTSFSWKYTSTNPGNPPIYVMLASGVLADNDFCEAYAGEDASGELLGRYTGNGETTGPLTTDGTSIFVTCQLPNTAVLINILIGPGGRTCGPSTIGTPYQIQSAMGTNTYCVYEHSTDLQSKFIFNFTRFGTTPSDFVSILPSDPDAPHLKKSGTVAPFVFETSGTGFRLIQTSDSFVSGGEFNVQITSEVEEGVVCQEEVFIALGENSLTNLTYEIGDTLYISSSRQLNFANIPSKCITSADSPIFNFNISECDATYQNGGDQLNVTMIIWNFKAMNRSLQIQRYISHNIIITCDFNTSYVVQSEVIMPQVSEIEQAADPVSGEFEISLNLYNNEWFNESLASNAEVTVPDYIFGKVNLDQIPSGVEDYIVQAEQCWATRTDNSSGQPSYPIIEMGCTAPLSEGEPSGAKEALRNYKPNFATFKLKSFVWTNFTDNQQHIYIHCDVTICQNSTGSCPGQMCVKRKKRALRKNDYQRLSVGPVRLVAEKTQKQKTTASEDMRRNVDASEENTDVVYTMTFVLIVVLLVIAVFIVREKSTKKHYWNGDKHLVSPLLE